MDCSGKWTTSYDINPATHGDPKESQQERVSSLFQHTIQLPSCSLSFMMYKLLESRGCLMAVGFTLPCNGKLLISFVL